MMRGRGDRPFLGTDQATLAYARAHIRHVFGKCLLTVGRKNVRGRRSRHWYAKRYGIKNYA